MLFKSTCQRLRMLTPVRHLKAVGTKVPDLHEPRYLDDLKPKVGYYDLLNLQLRAYDYAILEKYQSFLHKTMTKNLGVEITDAWSLPHQDLNVESLVDRSNAVESSYKLKIFERNIQLKNALITKIPILIDLIHYSLPPGVNFSIDRHTQTDEDKRYFKDSILENLKVELQELKDTPLIGA